MKLTEEQISNLMSPHRTATHLFTWCRELLTGNIQQITSQQVTTLTEIAGMSKQEHYKYIVWQNELYSVPRHVRLHRIPKINKKV